MNRKLQFNRMSYIFQIFFGRTLYLVFLIAFIFWTTNFSFVFFGRTTIPVLTTNCFFCFFWTYHYSSVLNAFLALGNAFLGQGNAFQLREMSFQARGMPFQARGMQMGRRWLRQARLSQVRKERFCRFISAFLSQGNAFIGQGNANGYENLIWLGY